MSEMYNENDLFDILVTGCDAVPVAQADGNKHIICTSCRPNGNPRDDLSVLPPNSILLSNVISDFRSPSTGELVSTGAQRIGNLARHIKESSARIAAIPIILAEAKHTVAIVIVRQPGNKFRVISFSPMGPEKYEGEFTASETAVIDALGGKDNVDLIRSRAVLQRDDNSCGPFVAEFLMRIMANPKLVTDDDFDINIITQQMWAKSKDIDALRAIQADTLACKDEPEKRGKLLEAAQLPGGRWTMERGDTIHEL